MVVRHGDLDLGVCVSVSGGLERSAGTAVDELAAAAHPAWPERRPTLPVSYSREPGNFA